MSGYRGNRPRSQAPAGRPRLRAYRPLRIGDLAASAGVFRDENFEWDGAFNALAIWQRPGRPHHLLDLTIMPHLPPGERPET